MSNTTGFDSGPSSGGAGRAGTDLPLNAETLEALRR
jgi:hypothetical protein